jgi:hypothetical protein
MTTLTAMITEIEDDLERSDTAAIRTKILGAIRIIQKERFFFNESRDTTFNTVAGTQDYSAAIVGAEFYEIDGVYITYGSSILDVDPVDYRVIELLRDATNTASVPTKYAYIDGLLCFYPEPDAAYSVRVTGHLKKDAPATDGEADNVWMTDGYDLIKARAMAKLFAERYRDVAGAAIAKTIESDARSALNGETNSKTGTGTVRSTKF